MATLINKGWLYLTNETDIMRVEFSKLSYDIKTKSNISHYGGGTNTSFNIGEQYLVIKIKNLWLRSKTEFETFTANILSWNKASGIKTSIEIDSSGTFWKLDGTNTKFWMRLKGGIASIEQVSPVSGIVKAGSIGFEQGGSAST